jgi:nucleoside 2-deoxyribosyltransferase
MARTKRVFVSFAIEDVKCRDMFCGQAKHPDTPFEFVDMSVKEPWDERWKTNCRSRIKGCDGVIVLVTKNTAKADGAMWEIQCAKDEGKPILGIYCTTDNRPSSSPSGIKVVDWTWANIKSFIDKL